MVISIPITAVSVAECISHFFREEKLQNYFCIGCKQEKGATLEITIAKHPKLLVIHLKRFQTFTTTSKKEDGVGQHMKKIKEFISYPILLEIGPYQVYKLVSLVVHWGSLEHGHYIAVSSNKGKWYYCNDKNITECDEKVALS